MPDHDDEAPTGTQKAPAKRHGALDDFEHRVEEARAQFDATNEKIRARTGRNLFAAIGIGLILAGLFLTSIVIPGLDWMFMIIAAALIGTAVFELSSALRFAGRDVPRAASTVVGVGLVPLAFFFGIDGLWVGLLVGVAIVTLWRFAELLRPGHRTGARSLVADIGAGAFVQVYVGFLASLYVVLVGLDGGEWWTLASITIVVMTDIGAYAAGLTLGRHKLAPTISPGKTWEGFAGSIVVAVICGILVTWIIPALGVPWWVGAIMGVLLALVGTMGDLTESLIKRDLGVKDISTWLPGHGGFLDRLDSMLPAAAVAYGIYVVVTSAGIA
ncbi:MAG: phosphatidate cytidylyltransferase [Pseudolysinimonas sp.]|uniref:phosphatidate cytidylyltransferase n=1 Tax=Pseudolysinimonas sp. TaxID=2680009 RepID=UPI003266256B